MSKEKKRPKDNEILNEEQKEQENPYGTQWPSIIGKPATPENDGKIRDVWGNVLG